MKQLIVNADDFGLTEGVNRGIIRAFQQGILTSATLMANAPAFADAVGLAAANPALGVGCHLVLVGGHAIAPREEIGPLADEDGLLPRSLPALVMKIAMRRVDVAAISREMLAQIQKMRGAGIEPTHYDTHKHTHCHPVVMEALAEVAAQTGVRKWRRPFENWADIWHATGSSCNGAGFAQRIGAFAAHAAEWKFDRFGRQNSLLSPDRFYGVTATGYLNADGIRRLLEELPDGTAELMCHPGECDAALRDTGTRLADQRQFELEALLNPILRNVLNGCSVQLVSYRELGEKSGRLGN
jgi:chitin disaccharide deacetylase